MEVTMTDTTTELSEADQARRSALVDRIFKATIESLELLHVYVGDRLGLYRVLAKEEPMSPSDLARAGGIQERYAREWLEQQAVAGMLDVESPAAEATERRYRLPAGHAEVLDDSDSLNYLAPLALGVAGIAGTLPAILEAFRTGGGVPYDAYGADIRGCIARLNRPMFLNQLGQEWFPSIPDVHGRLQAEPAALVADVGCGTGWSSLAIARAYPLVRVDGLDLDEASITEAHKNAAESGLGDRVTFEVRNAADPGLAGQYDLVTAFETVHDMADPVGALRAMRALVKDSGAVVIADEKVAEAFTAPGDELERFNYGWTGTKWHTNNRDRVQRGRGGSKDRETGPGRGGDRLDRAIVAPRPARRRDRSPG
jgi:hypothetical protein